MDFLCPPSPQLKMGSPPAYSQLPTSSTPEKPPLVRIDSATPATRDHSLRTRLALPFLAGALTVLILGSSGYAAAIGLDCHKKDRNGSTTHLDNNDGVRPGGRVKRSEPVSSPTYSTSVYENGETSTFVYTTRPIVGRHCAARDGEGLAGEPSELTTNASSQVNPGGFTFGTITAYVLAPTETTTLPSSPATTTPATTTPSSPATSSTPATTSRPCTTSTRLTKRPIFTASTIPSSLSHSPTPTTPLEARSFEDVDLHLLHRRGLNFEPPLPSAAEYSTSLNKHGETDLYVKTTRPIVRSLSSFARAGS